MKRKPNLLLTILVFFVLLLSIIISVYLYQRSKHVPNPIIYQNHCIAHGQYLNDSLAPNSMQLFRYLVEDMGYKMLELDVLFTEDNVPVLCHDWNICNIAVDSFGNSADVVVEQVTFKELCKYNFAKRPSQDKWLQISLFKDIIKYAKEKNVCIQVDIQKWVFTKENCRQLYDIVAEADMMNSVIWELSENNINFFARFDPFLIYQIDGKWTKELIDSYWILNYWSSQLVFLYQFHNDSDYENLQLKEMIDYGHSKGYLMMNAVINDSVIADSLFRQGTDLIDTGCLK